jgi:hypothetical protein
VQQAGSAAQARLALVIDLLLATMTWSLGVFFSLIRLAECSCVAIVILYQAIAELRKKCLNQNNFFFEVQFLSEDNMNITPCSIKKLKGLCDISSVLFFERQCTCSFPMFESTPTNRRKDQH